MSELSHRECASTFGRIIETSMSAFGSEEWFILSLEKSFQVLSVLILLVCGNIPYYLYVLNFEHLSIKRAMYELLSRNLIEMVLSRLID